MKEILESHKAPGVRMGWPIAGRYVDAVADRPGDPNGFCSTKREAIEKAKRKGLKPETF